MKAIMAIVTFLLMSAGSAEAQNLNIGGAAAGNDRQSQGYGGPHRHLGHRGPGHDHRLGRPPDGRGRPHRPEHHQGVDSEHAQSRSRPLSAAIDNERRA